MQKINGNYYNINELSQEENFWQGKLLYIFNFWNLKHSDVEFYVNSGKYGTTFIEVNDLAMGAHSYYSLAIEDVMKFYNVEFREYVRELDDRLASDLFKQAFSEYNQEFK